jgi:hypothetical protein
MPCPGNWSVDRRKPPPKTDVKKPPAGTLFIIAAVLFFLAAMVNPANRAVYIAVGVVFMILSTGKKTSR